MSFNHSGTTVFNPSWQVMPAELDDVLFGHEVHDQTLENLKDINSLVIVSTCDWLGDKNVHFLDGGHTNIVFGCAINSIKSREPARVTLAIIEIYHLNEFMHLDDMITELKPLAAAEIDELTNKGNQAND
ncbi:hypothetical protein OTK49_03400 [Vibrio coralliirubri]|uniref:hypothetical protein n=1 Tax=Vibrio coralliirubri TaxID=1516159 RepID=UPI002283F4A4|nr:hypothetical protein [Vibrio coralliirubri]MCY9861563.1 hypothetical protein [Vibrio coralliirubri]